MPCLGWSNQRNIKEKNHDKGLESLSFRRWYKKLIFFY